MFLICGNGKSGFIVQNMQVFHKMTQSFAVSWTSKLLNLHEPIATFRCSKCNTKYNQVLLFVTIAPNVQIILMGWPGECTKQSLVHLSRNGATESRDVLNETLASVTTPLAAGPL